jgi:hypothetical protein
MIHRDLYKLILPPPHHVGHKSNYDQTAVSQLSNVDGANYFYLFLWVESNKLGWASHPCPAKHSSPGLVKQAFLAEQDESGAKIIDIILAFS